MIEKGETLYAATVEIYSLPDSPKAGTRAEIFALHIARQIVRSSAITMTPAPRINRSAFNGALR